MKSEINYKSLGKVAGQLLATEGIMLLIPLLLEIIYGEPGWKGFLAASLFSLAAGFTLSFSLRRVPLQLHWKEGFILVSFGWILFSLIGMVPFIFCSHPLSVSDAFFETVSGFTTTGATTIADVEALSKGVLLWRAMTQWLGGLGIIMFMLAVLPSLNERSGLFLFNAEATGITHDKLRPRIRHTAYTLWMVYSSLTVVMFLLLWLGDMNFFDALCHSMTTISTGGFSTKNQSIAFWHSHYTDIVVIVFMFLGGVNFPLLYAIATGKRRNLSGADALKAYAVIVAAVSVLLSCHLLLRKLYGFGADVAVSPLFHTISTITTTGFTLDDFSHWGPFPLLLTFILMLCGACAGSTTGAIKIDRIVALGRNLRNEIRRSISPRRVFVVRIDGNVIPREELAKISAFTTLYLLLIFAGTFVVSAYGISLEDSFFAVVSCVGNNGLGYGLTGAAGGFHLLPDATKWMLSILMLTGRLELFSIFVMFFRSFWKH